MLTSGRQRLLEPDTQFPAGITIYAGISASPAKLKAADFLYPKLEAKKESANAYRDIVAEVNSFRKHPNYLASIDALQERYPELTKIVNYLDGYGNAITQKGITGKFKSWTGSNLEEYAFKESYNSTKRTIWDNILVQVILPDPNTPLTQLCKTIGAMNVIDKISSALRAKDKKELNSKQVYDAYHVQPLIPEWIVIAMTAKPDTADAAVNSIDYKAPDKTNKLHKEVRLCTKTMEELNKIKANKLQQAMSMQVKKNKEISEVLGQKLEREQEQSKIQTIVSKYNKLYSDPNILTQKDEQSMSPDIRAHLLLEYTNLAELDINSLINDEVQLSLELFADLGMTLNSPEIYLQGTLIDESGTKCQHYDNKAYCDDGRQATMPFISRGSFVNAMIIGDLLVTKQQLLKYDTGEVAHIENILAGESKTRTHRNLDRTEVTTTHESEAENETLRDLETTERFEMDKEASKVLSTNFNINAGVTASADYGTYQLGAYINGGYSSSTQESNKQASKFSKDVTEKTLQRVKTIVRDMQTVHVLKETESTNVHTLENPNAQHVNGVYQWVDKYYLNRIVNYGRRLMLEFQIPEPANFYLFRSIHSKLQNDSVIMPIEPAECKISVEKDKEIGLTSPTVLTDYNYTFWAAYYGATDIEPPPALYITSSYGIGALYGDPTDFQPSKTGVYSKDIPIMPDGYQVVAAKVYTHAFNTVYGILGDCYFSAGTNNMVFYASDNHTKQIGLVLFSQGALFNVVVTLNLRRTDELFQSWQLQHMEK